MKWHVFFTVSFMFFGNNIADRLARMSTCKISKDLQDKWLLREDPRTKLRIRQKSMVFKEPGRRVIRYKCLEAKKNIYLLRSRGFSPGKDGLICLGFSKNHTTFAEYRVVRLVRPAAGHMLMGPLLVPAGSDMKIESSCTGAKRLNFYSIQRANPDCRFAKELRQSWRTSLRFALNMTFTKSDFTITLLNGSSFTFRCEKRDKNLYLIRSVNLLPGRDGVMCSMIEPLEDPHYKFKLARLNLGNDESLLNMLKLVPRGQPMHPYNDCELVDSPARPDYLYSD